MSQPALLAGVILAAGAGTRMKSATPKVLHTLAGRTLLGHVINCVEQLNPRFLSVVVRHQRDLVAKEALSQSPSVIIADQDEVPGTGRALWCALQELSKQVPVAEFSGPVLVTAADTPLLEPAVLQNLLDSHIQQGNLITILTMNLDNPHGYGRIVRADQQVMGIVEEKDANDQQRKIQEVNSAIYIFDATILKTALENLDTNNAQGELYLTDVIAQTARQGGKVGAVLTPDPLTVAGINDKVQLAAMGKVLNQRLLAAHMRAGVTVVDPDSTWVDVQVSIAADSVIYPFTYLAGNTQVESNCQIGPHVTLYDCRVIAGTTVPMGEYRQVQIPASRSGDHPYSQSDSPQS